ncbi:beta-ketoacyl synthase chain length factor [Atopomonas sediminilitoris]|uniref:beta-ketoacyl synthase chain length factor n=1 Tax=Atopomonas sediminilitoris TaxID=2919919 RepID=UPI001F4EDE72|nr:beta-ketoacyl synthase chain length factor [Atopomonas sediminilitoris]MCJ8170364.1 beta-ketoacyl synthase chain length factor [Atopomonas sediminilitoris]
MEVPQDRQVIVLHFSIADWQAWAPGLTSHTDWQAWALDQRAVDNSDTTPDVSFLPAMQRRRLSPLARMSFCVGWPLAQAQGSLPLVFLSRHGETGRTAELLNQLAAQQPLSPTQFGLSVHNAIIGQWSILRGETAEMTALAGASDGFEQAFIEACLLLQQHPQVLLIVAEEAPAACYQPAIDDVPFSYALGLRLSRGEQFTLDWQAPSNDPSTAIAHPLSWLKHFLRSHTQWLHATPQRTWHWQQA